MELAIGILGIVGVITKGIGEAIAAARAGNEDEAFAILERVLSEGGEEVRGLRAALKVNREQALRDLAAKFGVVLP